MRKNRTGDVESEIHGYMPERFTLMYYELVRAGLAQVKSSLDGVGDRHGKGGSKSGGHVKSERAIESKRRIDRVLRQLAREVDSGMKADTPKCASCGKFVQLDWKHCAWCGTSQVGDLPAGVYTGHTYISPEKDPRRLR